NGDPSWQAGIIDIFGDLDDQTVRVYNSVIQNANVLTTSVGATGDNNYVHPTDETVSPNLDTVTFEPTSSSPIIGIGGSTPSYAVLDINGVERPLTNANLGAVQTVR